MIDHLISKGVKKHFTGQTVLFAVASLNEHFDGLQIHDTDIVEIEQWENDELVGTEKYIKASDVNFDGVVAKEVTPIEEVIAPTPQIGMPYEEAEKLLNLGELIALPEWGGFWFKNLNVEGILVLTKEGEITETPHEEYKERNDWIIVKATPEQEVLLDAYFATVKIPVETDDLDAENSELGVNNIVVVDSEEVVSETIKEPAIEEPVKATKTKKS